jgi:DNA-binding transcriptional ArsR family regulator
MNHFPSLFNSRNTLPRAVPQGIKRFFRIMLNSLPNLFITPLPMILERHITLRMVKFDQIHRIDLPLKARTDMVSFNERSLKHLLGWLIAGTRGGVTRAEIINALKERPQNANQLANTLKRDYRTIKHHLEVLSKNGMITSIGEGYGRTYFLSERLEENYSLFEEMLNKIWEKEKRRENE